MSKYQIEKQHNKGKYHAIERITLLLDKGSFREIGSRIVNYKYNDQSDSKPVEYDGVITGSGRINGKPVFVFAQDFSVRGGSLGLKHGRKIAHIIELAINSKRPVIGIYDSGGARIEEGVSALAGCGEMMYYNTLASGYILQISVIVGPCAGAAAYSPAITDFVFMVDKIGNMFITGVDVVRRVTGEESTMQELGGAKVHAEKSGICHYWYNKEKECFRGVRNLVTMLPSSWNDNICTSTNVYEELCETKIDKVLPEDPKYAYNMKDIIREFVDEESFTEVQESFAKSMIIGFAKLSGILIGLVANQPAINCGSIDFDSSDKAARFVRFCDSFNIPIITLVDTPGYLPGVNQEHKGIIRHGAKLLYAYADATVTKISVIVRKAYGGAYIAMGSKHLNSDYVYAWPSAEVAVMGAESATAILYKKEASALDGDSRNEFLQKKTDEYKIKFMNVNAAVQEGYVDEIIQPVIMRKRLYEDIITLQTNCKKPRIQKKHGNIPL